MTKQGLEIIKLQPRFNQHDSQGNWVSRQPYWKVATEEIAQLCRQPEENFGKLKLMYIKRKTVALLICLDTAGLCAGVHDLFLAQIAQISFKRSNIVLFCSSSKYIKSHSSVPAHLLWTDFVPLCLYRMNPVNETCYIPPRSVFSMTFHQGPYFQ